MQKSNDGVTLLLDTVVACRQLELISARSCALTLAVDPRDRRARRPPTLRTEAAPAAHCGPQRTRMCFETFMSHTVYSQNEPAGESKEVCTVHNV